MWRVAATLRGMARTRLRDDPTRPTDPALRSPRLRLADEAPTGDLARAEQDFEASVNPLLTVRMRVQNGYTEDGDKRYLWADVVTDRAVAWATRTEVDGSSGVTVEYANATVLYQGTATVNETAAVYVGDRQYRVTSAHVFPDRIEFALVRAHDGDS